MWCALDQNFVNGAIQINKTSIFSGILTPDQVFRGDEVTDQQITITTALMESVLSSSTVSCDDIESTIYQLFSLLEEIVSTNFPDDDETLITTTNEYYTAYVKRITPGTDTIITFDDVHSIRIPAAVTQSGIYHIHYIFKH